MKVNQAQHARPGQRLLPVSSMREFEVSSVAENENEKPVLSL